MSRSLNSVKNIVIGIGGQLSTYLIRFITRTLFIYTLGAEYLGIQGLFTNILSVLNIAELGVASAVAYTLYKPLAENDKDKVYAIMKFYKNAYTVIGLIILIAGLALMPALPYITKHTVDVAYINVLYILYLAETVASYMFFSYKRTILTADQKKYVVDGLTSGASVAIAIIKAIALIIAVNVTEPSLAFIIYLLLGYLGQLYTNYVIARKANKLYPYLKEKKAGKISKSDKKEMFKKIFGMAIYKINTTIVKSTDGIIISSFLGVAANGIYSNYYFITYNIYNVVKMFFSSITASVGNLITKESVQKSEFIFRCLGQISYWIFGFCAVCMFVLIEPFILLWAGSSYSLGEYAAWIFALEFLMEGYQVVSLTYKDASGLFWYGKYRPMVTAVLNIVISLMLVQNFGIAGVVLGTIISRLLTTWWFEPLLVYKKTFKMPVIGYFVKYILAVLLVAVSVAAVELISSLYVGNAIISFIIKLMLCLIIPNIIFFIAYRKTEEFEYVKKTVLGLFGGVIKKFKKKNVK